MSVFVHAEPGFSVTVFSRLDEVTTLITLLTPITFIALITQVLYVYIHIYSQVVAQDINGQTYSIPQAIRAYAFFDYLPLSQGTLITFLSSDPTDPDTGLKHQNISVSLLNRRAADSLETDTPPRVFAVTLGSDPCSR